MPKNSLAFNIASLYYFLSSLPQFSGSIIGVLFGAWVLSLGLLKSSSTMTASKRARTLSAQSNLSRKRFLGMSKIGIVVIVVVIVAIGGFATVYLPRLSSPAGASCNSTTSTVPVGNIVHISITSGAVNPSGAPGYSPDNVTLVIGQNNTVTWQNNDSAHHTVTTNSAPSGASFSSGDISAGDCFTHTFTTPGTYEYYCTYHSWMKGIIVVEGSSS
ncbi:MAG TPA: plastocyanin/azurin family copper-binding protein [Nitrososphaerales archaeon]|nr:plastocyanin/azurin family copper-binding protein [Nitrososphaerales archaeon]